MHSWVAVGVGAGLILVGGLFILWHVREWREERNDSSLDDFDVKHYHARYRRRMQTSGMLVFLGILIPLWDWLLDQKMVMPATLVGFLVFALVAWVIVLALGDMLSTRNHSHVAMSKVRQKQRELEKKVAELRRQENNGQSGNQSHG